MNGESNNVKFLGEKSLTGGTILSAVKTFAACHTALDISEFVYIV